MLLQFSRHHVIRSSPPYQHRQYFSLKGDVLILADAFEEFRTIFLKAPKDEIDPNTGFDIKPQLVVKEEGNYELDPAHYVSAPQLSWDAMLKQTRVQLELITDPEM